MGFLDNLENTMKAMESRVERDPDEIRRDQAALKAAKAAKLAAEPVAEELKNGPFTQALLVSCRTVGHSLRTMVRVTWLDSILRLEAKDKKCELGPEPDGVHVIYYVDGVEKSREKVDLKGDAEKFVRRWLEA